FTVTNSDVDLVSSSTTYYPFVDGLTAVNSTIGLEAVLNGMITLTNSSLLGTMDQYYGYVATFTVTNSDVDLVSSSTTYYPFVDGLTAVNSTIALEAAFNGMITVTNSSLSGTMDLYFGYAVTLTSTNSDVDLISSSAVYSPLVNGLTSQDSTIELNQINIYGIVTMMDSLLVLRESRINGNFTFTDSTIQMVQTTGLLDKCIMNNCITSFSQSWILYNWTIYYQFKEDTPYLVGESQVFGDLQTYSAYLEYQKSGDFVILSSVLIPSMGALVVEVSVNRGTTYYARIKISAGSLSTNFVTINVPSEAPESTEDASWTFLITIPITLMSLVLWRKFRRKIS
ncbi:MAG: hypothetical protein ACFFC7_27050, partial [Candidatus Hermodarchaeota archaeon]